MYYKSFFFVALVATFGCGTDLGNSSSWNELNLMQHGIPFSINAPDSAKIETVDYGTVLKDVSIKKGDDYFVQIFSSDATTTDLKKLKDKQLEEVKAKRHFSKLIEDYEDGFIFENKKDSTQLYYGFRYLKLQGGKEFVIQNGLIGFFSEKATRSMYKAVSAKN